MIINTKVSFKQYAKLLFALAYKKPLMKILVCVAGLLLGWIVCYHLNLLELPKPLIYQYLTLILISIVQPAFIFFMIWRNYQSSNYLREPLQMELTQEEIAITGESFYMEIYWKKMYKIVEEAHWFVIYQNNLSAIIIPKKGLHGNEMEDLKKILAGISEVPVSLKS